MIWLISILLGVELMALLWLKWGSVFARWIQNNLRRSNPDNHAARVRMTGEDRTNNLCSRLVVIPTGETNQQRRTSRVICSSVFGSAVISRRTLRTTLTRMARAGCIL